MAGETPEEKEWTDLTDRLSSTGKDFVILTADGKSREGSTAGSALGNMFLDSNTDIYERFLNFCAVHYQTTEKVGNVKVTEEDAYRGSEASCKKNVTCLPDVSVNNTEDEGVTSNDDNNDIDEEGFPHVEEDEYQIHVNQNKEPTEIMNKVVRKKIKIENNTDKNSETSPSKKRRISKPEEIQISHDEKKTFMAENKMGTPAVRRSTRLVTNKSAVMRTRKGKNQENNNNGKVKYLKVMDLQEAKETKDNKGDEKEEDDKEEIKEEEEGVRCFGCGEILSNKKNYIKHVLSAHKLAAKDKDKLMKNMSLKIDCKHCPVCGQFTEVKGMNSHLLVHCLDIKKYSCDLCPAEFVEESKIDEHKKVFHWSSSESPSDQSLKDPEDGEPVKNLVCPVCGVTVASAISLGRHMIIHNKDKKTKIKEYDPSKGFDCKICGVHLTQRSSYIRHMRNHVGENTHRCSHCGEEFKEKEDLKSHILTHEGVDHRPYKCDTCDRTFKTRSGKRSHMMYSHGDKGLSKYGKEKFECRFCGGVMGSHHTLLRHEARHEKENEKQLMKMGSFMEMAREGRKVMSVDQMKAANFEVHLKTDDQVQSNLDKLPQNGSLKPEEQSSSEIIEVQPPPEGDTVSFAKVDNTEQDKNLTTESINQSKTDDDLKLKHTCRICDKKFPSARFLKDHMKVHSSGGKSSYVCDLCGKIFLRTLSLYKHRQLHDKSGKFTCKTCSKQFDSVECLRRHAKIHLDVKPFICKVCGKGCTEKRNLETHMLVHTKKKEFICEVCGKAYRTQQGLKEHGYIHTGERPYACKVCKMAFRSHDVLRNHMALHSEFKKFMCDTCGKTFRQQSCLITHQHTHSNIPTHVCKVCGQGCKSSSSLNSHFVSFHLKPEDVPNYKFSVHACDVCGKLFGEKQDYERHQRTHTGEKPFKCDVCQKSFADKSNLRSHVRNHKGDRSKKCQYCGKGFLFNRDLKKHLLSHSNKSKHAITLVESLQTDQQEAVVPIVDNVVTVVTHSETPPPGEHLESHDQHNGSVTQTYETVTAVPIQQTIVSNIETVGHTENMNAVSLIQDAASGMVHMGVYSTTGDLTWHTM